MEVYTLSCQVNLNLVYIHPREPLESEHELHEFSQKIIHFTEHQQRFHSDLQLFFEICLDMVHIT